MTEYMLDNAWQEARQRLAALKAWLDPGTTQRLEAPGVATGWQCWEVEAGGLRVRHGLLRSQGYPRGSEEAASWTVRV